MTNSAAKEAPDERPDPMPLARLIASVPMNEGLVLAEDNLATAAQLRAYMKSFEGMDAEEASKAAIVGLAGAVLPLLP